MAIRDIFRRRLRMASDPRHFLNLIKVELDDLIEDIKLLMERNDRKHQKDEITEYVHLENGALLRRELDAFLKFIEIVDGIDPALYKCTSDAATDLLRRSRDFVSRFEDPEAVFLLIKRKLEKVLMYVASDDGPTVCK